MDVWDDNWPATGTWKRCKTADEQPHDITSCGDTYEYWSLNTGATPLSLPHPRHFSKGKEVW